VKRISNQARSSLRIGDKRDGCDERRRPDAGSIRPENLDYKTTAALLRKFRTMGTDWR
jgi:hypothetical protein